MEVGLEVALGFELGFEFGFEFECSILAQYMFVAVIFFAVLGINVTCLSHLGVLEGSWDVFVGLGRLWSV